MSDIDVQNGWEFYRAYHSVKRHVMSKSKGWKYDLFVHGLWEKVDQNKFMESKSTIRIWSDLSAEVLQIHPNINRMGVIRAFSMAFFLADNKFYFNEHSGADIITAYTEYTKIVKFSSVEFQNDLVTLSKCYKEQGLNFKRGMAKCSADELPNIMHQYYSGAITMQTVYLLNNLFKASNPNKLSLVTFLRNIDNNNVFLKMFSRNIQMWELMFEFDYKTLSGLYIKAYHDHNNSL